MEREEEQKNPSEIVFENIFAEEEEPQKGSQRKKTITDEAI